MDSITRHAIFMQLYIFSSPLQSSLHTPFPLVYCTILTVSWFDLCPSFFIFSEMLLCFLKPCKDNCFVGVPSGCYSSLHTPFPLVYCTILTVSWFDLCPSFFIFSEMLLCFLKPCKDNCFVGVPSGCYSHLSSHFPLASFFR